MISRVFYTLGNKRSNDNNVMYVHGSNNLKVASYMACNKFSMSGRFNFIV